MTSQTVRGKLRVSALQNSGKAVIGEPVDWAVRWLAILVKTIFVTPALALTR